MIAFDTETTGIDPQQADLVGLAVAWGREAHQAAYIPLRHADTPGLPWETVREALQPALADPQITKVAHNASYDLAILARNGLRIVSGPSTLPAVAGHGLVDTMIAAWLIDPGSRGLGLKDLAWTRLRAEMTPIAELIGSGKNQITMDQRAGRDGRGLRQRGCRHDAAAGRGPAARTCGEGVGVAVPRPRNAARPGAGRHGSGRGQARCRCAPADVGRTDRPAAPTGVGNSADRRLCLQHQFDAAALRCVVRQTGLADRGVEEDPGGHVFHRGRCPGRACAAGTRS